MEYLYFYMIFARIQAGKFGRAVSVSDLCRETNLSRSTVNRRLKALIKSNFVHKPKRGKYYLTDCDGAIAIGLSVVSPLEMSSYQINKMEWMVENEL